MSLHCSQKSSLIPRLDHSGLGKGWSCPMTSSDTIVALFPSPHHFGFMKNIHTTRSTLGVYDCYTDEAFNV